MADTIKVSIGAALSSGFSGAFSSAENRVDALGTSIASLKGKVGDVGAHRRMQSETIALGNSLDEAKKKTASLREEIAKSEKPTKAQTKALKEAEREELAVTKALDKKTEALKVSSQNLRTAGVDTSKLADEEKRLTAELARQEGVRNSMSRLKDHLGIGGETRIRSIGDHFNSLRTSATSAFRDIALVGGAAGASIFALAKSTADYGDEVAETANYIGISTQALQEFRGVGMRVGVETEAMDTALAKFSINLGKAANNGAKGRQEFRKMGLNLDQLIKMGPDKAMMRVADAIGRMPKHTKQAAAAVEIFGKSGLKMLNILGGGSKELERMREEVRKTGMVMGPEQLAIADEFDNSWNGMKQTMLGVRNTIGIALVPAFTEMFGKLSGYVQTHGPEIQAFAQKLATGFAQFAEKIPGIVSDIGSLFGKLWTLADGAQKLAGGWDNLAIAMAGVRMAPVAVEMGGLGKSIWGIVSSLKGMSAAAGGLFPLLTSQFPALSAGILAIGAALMATPIGWLIAGIAAVVGSLFVLYKYFDYVRAFASGMFTGLITGLAPVIEAFQPLLNLVGSLVDVVKSLFNWFMGLLSPVTATTEGLKAATDAGVQFGQIVGNAISAMMFPITAVLNGINKIGGALGLVDEPSTGATAGSIAGAAISASNPSVAPVPVPQARPGNLSQTNNTTVHMKIDGSKDPQATAKAVRDEMDKFNRERAAHNRSSYADHGGF